MTNDDIIFTHSQQLAKDGRIAYTGRELHIPLEGGGEMVVKETEQIHTFAAWKEIGFSVKKGEHAVAKFPVWKYKAKVDEKTGQENGQMFMKTSAFFAASQVEPLK